MVEKKRPKMVRGATRSEYDTMVATHKDIGKELAARWQTWIDAMVPLARESGKIELVDLLLCDLLLLLDADRNLEALSCYAEFALSTIRNSHVDFREVSDRCREGKHRHAHVPIVIPSVRHRADYDSLGSIIPREEGGWLVQLEGDVFPVDPETAKHTDKSSGHMSFSFVPRPIDGRPPCLQIEIAAHCPVQPFHHRFMTGLTSLEVLHALDSGALTDCMSLLGADPDAARLFPDDKDGGPRGALCQATLRETGTFSLRLLTVEILEWPTALQENPELLAEMDPPVLAHTEFQCDEAGYRMLRDYLCGSLESPEERAKHTASAIRWDEQAKDGKGAFVKVYPASTPP